jgi:phosphatidylglycerophosphate synthase
MATTWTHRLARAVVRPLVGTGITPNHLTTLRWLTGLGACILVATGDRAWQVGAACLWVLSAFLDRADGELARIGDMMSEAGHRYDYLADLWINALIFAAVGLGARHGWMGFWAIPIGLLTMIAMLVCWVGGEAYQKRDGAHRKPYAGRWGFDLDDGLYLLALPIAFSQMGVVLIGAGLATSVMAVTILVRLNRLKERQVIPVQPTRLGAEV